MSAELQALYEKIPSFTCKSGCTDCCGPVPFSADEMARLGTAKSKLGKVGCLDCPFIENGGCAVYENRPFMCRLFGAVADDPLLRCPHGCKPEVPLTAVQAREMADEYREIIRKDEEAAVIAEHRALRAHKEARKS